MKDELTRVSDLLDGTQTDVISFFDEVQFLMMMIRMLMMKMDKKMGISVCVCVYSILSPVCSPLTGALGQMPREKRWIDDPSVCILEREKYSLD